MKGANNNGFCIIRLLQNDIYQNKYDWFDELITNIETFTHCPEIL